MIIVNQDKTAIINFDKISEIIVNGNEIAITDDIYKEIGESIGVYKTKERAKEVLQEIIKTYKTTEGYKCSNNLSFHKELIEDAERNNRDVFLYVMPSK